MTPTPEDISSMLSVASQHWQELIVKDMIPTFRKLGFFTGETDRQIIDKPFCVVMSAWNMSAWFELLPSTGIDPGHSTPPK